MVQGESALKREMHAHIRSRGGYVIPLPAEAHSVKGNPDFVACYKGRFLAIEAKTREGTLSDWQKERLVRIRRAGGYALVCRSVKDVEDALNILDDIADCESKGSHLDWKDIMSLTKND